MKSVLFLVLLAILTSPVYADTRTEAVQAYLNAYLPSGSANVQYVSDQTRAQRGWVVVSACGVSAEAQFSDKAVSAIQKELSNPEAWSYFTKVCPAQAAALKKVYRACVQSKPVVVAGSIPTRVVHRMDKPCFECGTTAPVGSWEHDVNKVLEAGASGLGYAAAGYFIGEGIKHRAADVVNNNISNTVNNPGGSTPGSKGPVGAPAPAPVSTPTPVPSGGLPTGSNAPPPGPLGPQTW
ncbi:hypothetical protein ACFLY0_00225 [Patescibacteria group bacterium]